MPIRFVCWFVLLACLIFTLNPDTSLFAEEPHPGPSTSPTHETAATPSAQGQTPPSQTAEAPNNPSQTAAAPSAQAQTPPSQTATTPSAQGQTPPSQTAATPNAQAQTPPSQTAATPNAQAQTPPSQTAATPPETKPQPAKTKTQPDKATLALLDELSQRRGFIPPGQLFTHEGFPLVETLWQSQPSPLLPGMFERTVTQIDPDSIALCYQSDSLHDRFCFDLLHPQQARRGYVSGPVFAVGLPVGLQSFSAWAAWYEVASVLVRAKPNKPLWCRLDTEKDTPPARMDEEALIAHLLRAARSLALSGAEAKQVDGLLDAAKSVSSRPNLSLELFNARWLWFTGNGEGAKAGLRRLKKNRPAEAEIDLELARLALWSDQVSKGLERYAALWDELGRSGKTCGLEDVAQWQRARNPDSDVLSWLARGVEIFPACLDARLELAQRLAERGRTAEALEALDTVLTERGKRPQDWLLKARWLLRMDQADESLAALEQAFRLTETLDGQVRILQQLGRIAPTVRNKTELGAYLEKRLSDEPEDPYALHGLASLAFFDGAYSRAARLAQRLRDKVPQDDMALVLGMVAHHEQDNAVEAERWLAMLQDRPVAYDADVLYALAMMNETANPKRAIGYLQAALALPPHPGARLASPKRMRQALDLMTQGLPVPFWQVRSARLTDITLSSLLEQAGLDKVPGYLWWILLALFPLGYLLGLWRGTSRWP